MDMVSRRSFTNSNGSKESAYDADRDDADNADDDADDADDAMSAARRMSRRCSPVTTTAGFH